MGPPLTANATMGALGGIVASRIAREFRAGGPSFTIANEENSGVRALQGAMRLLQQGELDHALVGAVDLAGDVRAVLPTHAHRRVSAPDSSVLGEGATAVVLKRLADAERDGDRVYAILSGAGAASGADAIGISLGQACAEVRPGQIPSIVPGADDAIFGVCVAASGLAHVVKTALGLHQHILAAGTRTGPAILVARPRCRPPTCGRRFAGRGRQRLARTPRRI